MHGFATALRVEQLLTLARLSFTKVAHSVPIFS
jgi:hypothetical protein